MRVLIACEFSGIVRNAFRDLGHDAWSCDLIPCERGGQHILGDVRRHLFGGFGLRPDQCPWDLMIAHPPCTYLARSGIHWNSRIPGRAAKTEEALQFVRDLLSAPIPRIALENPIGVVSTRVRRYDQVIHPWEFGHDANKTTCLWLVGLPPLVPTKIISPRIVNGKALWSDQTDSGQNRLPPSTNRSKNRSRTYAGIAQAMAEQWG